MTKNTSGNLYYQVLLDNCASMSRNIPEVIDELTTKIGLLKADSEGNAKKCKASKWSFNTRIKKLSVSQVIENIPSIRPLSRINWDECGYVVSLNPSLSSFQK